MEKSIHSNDYLRLIAWLKAGRLARGYSMRDLAVMIDEPHSFIGKVETAERRLDVAEYVQYCHALGLEPCEGLKLFKK
ncbi:helix-turn-helix domain-containing protein [Microbulbifer sp. CnH-101-G]|uniref:helix-turn-helix domain-containing protein n=1 Tax=Microbulbifer sp. CnH-101-G TaxID=3243393 RepID=UPI00403A05B1